MNTVKELIDALEAAGITEDYRIKILKAVEIEKCDAILAALEEVKVNINSLKCDE